jgi:acetylglutamate kinase
MDVVRMVLVGQVGASSSACSTSTAPIAVGLSGEDAGLLTARGARGNPSTASRSTSARSAM